MTTLRIADSEMQHDRGGRRDRERREHRGSWRPRRAGAWLTVAVALLVGGCAAGTAFRQGDTAMRNGQLDEAVAAYRKALQASPENTNYKIALQRALQAASRAHLEKAHDFE